MNWNWEKMWVPELPPTEIIFRSAVVFLFVHICFRILGRKEWTRYSAFNVSILFLIAVALRMTIVENDPSITAGLLSLSTILGLDWLFSYASFRSKRVSNLLNGATKHLMRNGECDLVQLRRARISREQLLSELRLRGCWNLDHVEEALLESNGHISFKFKNDPSNIDHKAA
jgi:uncharacterized membrane protein YcaP (DUF421 family)